MHNGRTRVRACVLPPSGCVGIVVGGWGWMALVKRKGPPAVSRHNTRPRKRHSRSAYWWPRGYLPTREQDIYREETRGVACHPFSARRSSTTLAILLAYSELRGHRLLLRTITLLSNLKPAVSRESQSRRGKAKTLCHFLIFQEKEKTHFLKNYCFKNFTKNYRNN